MAYRLGGQHTTAVPSNPHPPAALRSEEMFSPNLVNLREGTGEFIRDEKLPTRQLGIVKARLQTRLLLGCLAAVQHLPLGSDQHENRESVPESGSRRLSMAAFHILAKSAAMTVVESSGRGAMHA